MDQSSDVIEFEIMGLPPMYNAHNRQHWSKKRSEKNKWTRLVGDCLYGKIPHRPFKIYKLYLKRYSSTEPDYDGLVSSWKYIIDALRHYKVIEDDKLSNSGSWDVSWEKCKQKYGKICVRVEEYKLQLIDEIP